MTTKPQSLTYQHLIDAIANLPPCVPPVQIYYSPSATKEETITRTWKERLFSFPWRPRQKHKLQSQPAIYLAIIPCPHLLPTSLQHKTTIFIAHPSFKDAIERVLGDQSQ